MKMSRFIAFISCFLFVAGCQNAGQELIGEDTEEFAVETESNDLSGTEGFLSYSEEVSNHVEELDFTEQRMVSYHSNINVKVENLINSMGYVQELATQYKGYLVESSYTDSETDPDAFMIFRIPEESFKDFIEEVRDHASKVTHQETYTQDVTEEYVDLDSRLSSKKAVEERLLQFLDEAEETENVLAISNELANTQEEVERILGRMRYLENQVVYSTISILLKEDVVRIGTLQGEGELNTWQKAKKLFIDTVNFLMTLLSSVIVLLIGLSPVMIPFIALIIVFWIKWKRHNKKKQNELSGG